MSETVEEEIDISDILEEYNVKLEEGTDPTVTVRVKIEKWGDTTVAFPVSELKIISYPEGKNLVFTPADQLLIGVRSTGSEIASITADEMTASVDLTDYQDAGTYTVPVDIELPEGYELVSPVTIYVNIEDVEQSSPDTE